MCIQCCGRKRKGCFALEERMVGSFGGGYLANCGLMACVARPLVHPSLNGEKVYNRTGRLAGIVSTKPFKSSEIGMKQRHL